MSDYSVDLSDPRVRDLLGTSPSLSTGKPVREVVQLAGDAPDPTGVTGGRGLLSTHRLNAGKQEVVVVYKDLILTVDIYALPGEPLRAQLICPRCHKHLTIPGDRKKIEFEPTSLNPVRQKILEMTGMSRPPPSNPTIMDNAVREAWGGLMKLSEFGRLSVETFECTWEIGDEQHVPGAMHTGASLCRLRLVIEDNRAQEA